MFALQDSMYIASIFLGYNEFNLFYSFSSLNKRAIIDYRGNMPTYFNRKQRYTIDLWPILLPNRASYTYSSELLLMMGHIAKQTDIWYSYSKLRVKGIARNDSEVEFVKGCLEALISNVRIKSGSPQSNPTFLDTRMSLPTEKPSSPIQSNNSPKNGRSLSRTNTSISSPS